MTAQGFKTCLVLLGDFNVLNQFSFMLPLSINGLNTQGFRYTKVNKEITLSQ